MKCFPVADAMPGFTNIHLDRESSLATTFQNLLAGTTTTTTTFIYSIPAGEKWLRLPYGVPSGLEEYQARQREALAGLKGVCNIADDILIYGRGQTKGEAEKDYHENLYNVLLRMQQVKLKLNPTKRRFKTEMIFMGLQLSPEGVSSAPSMSEAILSIPKPSDPHAVQRYFARLNFFAIRRCHL